MNEEKCGGVVRLEEEKKGENHGRKREIVKVR